MSRQPAETPVILDALFASGKPITAAEAKAAVGEKMELTDKVKIAVSNYLAQHTKTGTLVSDA